MDIFYSNVQLDPSIPPPTTQLGKALTHPIWVSLSADIFTGQIIASLIVLIFVAMFLLREWISQNARPGIFEDEDAPLEDRAPEQVIPPQARNPRAQLPLNDDDALALAQRQVEALQALRDLRMREGIDGHVVGEDRNHGRTAIDLPKGLGVRMPGQPRTEEEEDRFAAARARRRLVPTALDELEEDMDNHRRVMRRRGFRRPMLDVGRAPRRRPVDLPPVPPPVQTQPLLPSGVQTQFKFSFRLGEQDSPSEPGPSSSNGSTFPAVTLQPPKGTIPFSLRLPSPSSSTSISEPSPASTTPPTPLRRPSLPTTVPVSPGSPVTPMESPNLATYRAPEDLDPDDGYFRAPVDVPQAVIEEAEDNDDDWETEDDEDVQYFRDPLPSEEAANIPAEQVVPVAQEARQDDEEETLRYSSDSEYEDEVNNGDDIPRLLEQDVDEEDEEDDMDGDQDGPNFEPEEMWEGLDDDDDEEEEDDDGDADLGPDPVDQGDGDGPAAAPALEIALRQAAQDVDEALLDLNEDQENNVEDDMDGAMEGL